MLEVCSELGGGRLRAQGRLQPTVESSGGDMGSVEAAAEFTSVTLVSLLSSLRMPLENHHSQERHSL